MYLFQSWKESLLLFKPENFKLFMLVTLKLLIEAVKVWLKYFWWIIVFAVALDITSFFLKGIVLGLSLAFVRYFLLFAFFLSVWFSVKRKTLSYFWSYKCYLVLLMIVVLLMVSEFILLMFLGGAIFLIFGGPNAYAAFVVASTTERLLLFGPLIWIFVLFFLDSKGRVRDFCFSFWRSCKMLVFNFPFYLIMFLLSEFIRDLFHFNVSFIRLTRLDFYINLLLLPIYICVFTNFYIKRMHDQSKFYFGD